MSLLSYGFSLTPRRSMRERVERYEELLAQLPQEDFPVRHHFAPGVYIRELFIRAGLSATGAVHKTEHLSIVVGHCRLTTDDGVVEINGQETRLSKPGVKRAIVALGDTTMWTIHPTSETDLDKLCLELTESKPDELLGGPNSPQALVQKQKELEA
jgi:hypothetical protein